MTSIESVARCGRIRQKKHAGQVSNIEEYNIVFIRVDSWFHLASRIKSPCAHFLYRFQVSPLLLRNMNNSTERRERQGIFHLLFTIYYLLLVGQAATLQICVHWRSSAVVDYFSVFSVLFVVRQSGARYRTLPAQFSFLSGRRQKVFTGYDPLAGFMLQLKTGFPGDPSAFFTRIGIFGHAGCINTFGDLAGG